MRYLALILMFSLPGHAFAQSQTSTDDVAAEVLKRLGGNPAPQAPAPADTASEGGTAPATTTPAELPTTEPTQDIRPVLTAEMEKTTAIPGQPLTLRLTVLVPTWLPKPVVFPSFEVPNVLIRLPEKSTGPTSQTINGETWSGITRLYRFYPMIDGVFSIPAQDLIVTYADPETSAPIEVTVTSPALEFAGRRPEGTQDLDPFVAAETLTIETSITGAPSALKPGDAFTRQLTVTITGTSPIFLPPLLETTSPTGLAAYPAEPVVSETEDRGVLSGTRQESITYVAEAGLKGALPAVQLQWYNLKTGTVQTAKVDELQVFADGPPPAEIKEARNLRQLALIGMIAVLIVAISAFALGWALPRLKASKNRRRAAYLASEAYAFEQLRQALMSKDYGRTAVAIRQWRSLAPVLTMAENEHLQTALTQISRARYSATPSGLAENNWSALGEALSLIRHTQLNTAKQHTTSPGLPPLNPRTL